MTEGIVDQRYLHPVALKDLIGRSDIYDHSKVDARDGRLYFFLYRQDGTKQPMDCADNFMNRCYVSWMQIHDRWKGATA